jgi:hypothetical protein
VVSVLATGPKVCGFEPFQGDGFLRAIKICVTPPSRMGSKVRGSHVIRFCGMQKNSSSLTGTNRQNSHFLARLLLLRRSLVVELEVSPSRCHSATFAFVRGYYNRPPAAVLGRSLAPPQLPICQFRRILFILRSLRFSWTFRSNV